MGRTARSCTYGAFLLNESSDIFPSPSTEEHKRFLISFLFGGDLDPGPIGCVARAYRDFSRTAHGITKGSEGSVLKRSAHDLVVAALVEALNRAHPWPRSVFDAWHERACTRICKHYARRGYHSFRIGHAQKWLNMSIKYALSLAAMEMVAINHARTLRRVAHVPLDEYVLTALQAYDAPTLPRRWSQIRDYSVYMDVQKWIRTRFPDSSPLDVEFHIYAREATRRRQNAVRTSTRSRG